MPALECFIDHIGLFYCDEGAYDGPASGLYLNQLPGISIEGMQHIADSDQESYLVLWADIQKTAGTEFFLEVRNEIRKCHTLNGTCDYDELICNNIEELTLAWQYKLAVVLCYFRLFTDRVNFWTTVTRDEAAQMRDFYIEKYNVALNQGVLLLDTTGCCMDCGGNPRIVTWLP